MTDYERQSELDDELLSAYLDDELSSDDRAAVEARLATDPTAQQLLHQLRAVSEAVQALPQEVVGHDMRDSILYAANEARQAAATSELHAASDHVDASNGHATPGPDDAPSFTFGRTRRGWIWASLAIAAALMIMVFGREPERDDLTSIAKREDRAGSARGGAGIPELRAVNEPAAASATDPESAQPPAASLAWDARTADSDAATNSDSVPARPAAPATAAESEPAPEALPRGRAREFAQSMETRGAAAPAQPQAESRRSFRAAAAPAPAGEVKDEALGEKFAEMPAPADHLAAAEPAAQFNEGVPPDRFGVAGNAGGKPAAVPADKDQSIENPLLVVRVHAKRTALERKTFDQLLERSGIEVESEEADEYGLGIRNNSQRAARRVAENGQADGAMDPTTDQPAEAATVDAVLVEAPPAVIVACVAGLNQDQENYLGLVVDDTGAVKTTSAVDAPADSKGLNKQQLAANLELTKYNRGSVPAEQESLARDKHYFYRYGGANFAGGLGGASADELRLELLQQGPLLRARKAFTESNEALAVRLKDWGTITPAPEPSQSLAQQSAQGVRANESDRNESAATLRMQDLSREMKEAEQAPADNKLQVLFLFSSEEPAAATPTPASRGKAQ